jgi:lysophospholipase L1-like esterase
MPPLDPGAAAATRFGVLMKPFSHPAIAALFLSAASLSAAELEVLPDPVAFAGFSPVKAPARSGLLLRKDDRLAIIGDSITEQRMYSRLIETYLAACLPELNVSVRQYGWSGETAEGFAGRMANDALRFQPTIATSCYGMNDHRYTDYNAANGAWYRSNQVAIVRAFKSAGARFVLGSPGCVGPKVPWSKSTSLAMNLNLCELRNIDIGIAAEEKVSFADVFWPMLTLNAVATNRYGADYAIAGKDSVHPGWAGHVVMAVAFLDALGIDGDLGTITADLGKGGAGATGGHRIDGAAAGEIRVVSTRYPFCAPAGELKDDGAMRSGMDLTGFNGRFNRLRLVATGGSAKSYRVSWGAETRTFTDAQLAAGINLPAEFPRTPFDEAFRAVDEAVARKQAYETRQIKTLFHGEEGHEDMAATVALTEKTRAPFVAAVAKAFNPVAHTIRIEPVL